MRMKKISMTDDKKEKLKSSGFQVGSIAEFLDLSPEEQSMIENVIIRNGKPIGICECLGKGKGNCRGNGWIKDGAGFQTCPYFIDFK
jgi:hypothetical protein